MADEKKDFKDKKDDKKSGPNPNLPDGDVNRAYMEIALVTLLVMALLGILGNIRIGDGRSILYSLLNSLGIIDLYHRIAVAYLVFANILSIILVIGIAYCIIRILQLEHTWYEQLYPDPPQAEGMEDQPKSSKWERILEHIASSNPSDWRLAILEADILLDEILDKNGYAGDTIGDKLKKAEGHINNLNAAWEAHKIRNAIAHQGQDFTLTEREARRVIGLYETVFREFDYI